MKVLVLGGGGREHALAWRLERDGHAVTCCPGNAGTAAVAEHVAGDATDTAFVRELAAQGGFDLVVVGPEAPLVAGVTDALAAAEVPVFGPTAAAARIESSKSFAKDVMSAAGVPTAAYWSGRDLDGALAALDRFSPPYVVKADGLAAGKGVRICEARDEAERAVRELMVDQLLGAAGSTVVVEEFLSGPEVSVFALCDGTGAFRLLPAAQDFKRARDGDTGPNTGGMGAYAPVPFFDAGLRAEAEQLVGATLHALGDRGLPYAGVLYAGCVATRDGLKVLEFNARFGDPEAQVVLPLLDGDAGALLLACARGELGDAPPAAAAGAAVTVVLASGGYPGPYETGLPIAGLDAAAQVPGALVFHAGTRAEGGEIVTAGGRVLAVTGVAGSLAAARDVAYTAADRITFEGLQRRSDIAAAAA